jgi:small basic protein (TIGR04137 family)
MSIDKSLRRKNTLERARNVLTRGERIKTLKEEERWQEGRSPYALPKVRVHRIVIKKAKKAKEEEKPAAEGEAAAAAPAQEAPKKEEKKEKK